MVDMYRGPEADDQPSAYHVHGTEAAPDALLAGDGWQTARGLHWGPARYATTFRACWRPDGVCVRWDARDDAPWATRTRRDDCLWETEVVEVFLDPTGTGEDYAEIEITPTNVVCDLRIERLVPDRRVHLAWDFPGLHTAVHPGAERGDWTAIAWLPFTGFAALAPRVAACVPPRAGAAWQFNAFRIKRPGGPHAPEDGAIYAAWSVPDGPSFHEPTAFRPFIFL